MYFMQIIMSIISHGILVQRALPVASYIINRWVINCNILEDDFLPAVIHPMPHASVLVTVEPGTGRILGPRWKVSGALEQPIKFKASRMFSEVPDKSVAFTINLPPLFNFKFKGAGAHKNFSD